MLVPSDPRQTPIEVIVLSGGSVERDVGNAAGAGAAGAHTGLEGRRGEMNAASASAAAVVARAALRGGSPGPGDLARVGSIVEQLQQRAADTDDVRVGGRVAHANRRAVVGGAAIAGGRHQRPALADHLVEDVVAGIHLACTASGNFGAAPARAENQCVSVGQHLRCTCPRQIRRPGRRRPAPCRGSCRSCWPWRETTRCPTPFPHHWSRAGSARPCKPRVPRRWGWS